MPPKGKGRTRKSGPSKAEQERRAKQAAEAAKANGDGDEVPMANGVIITRTDDGEGNIGLQTAPMGDVKITEIPTLLAMAKKQLEQRLGIAE